MATPRLPIGRQMEQAVGREMEPEEKEEKTIKFYLEAFLDRIIYYIQWKDFVLNYKLFTPEQKQDLHAIGNSRPEDVTRRGIDLIINGLTDVPGKYRALQDAMEISENWKVVDILKGKLIPADQHHKELIYSFGKSLCEQLISFEVLPSLVAEGIIVAREAENIYLKHIQSGSWDASFDLLFLLPKRNQHWYKKFIKVLLKSNHDELARKIDKKLCDKIEGGDDSGDILVSGEYPSWRDVNNLPVFSGVTQGHMKDYCEPSMNNLNQPPPVSPTQYDSRSITSTPSLHEGKISNLAQNLDNCNIKPEMLKDSAFSLPDDRLTAKKEVAVKISDSENEAEKNKENDDNNGLSSDDDDEEDDAENDETSELKLRDYQLELAENALAGRNTIVCAGTGSGKTLVACYIIMKHLQTRSNVPRKVVFMARTNLLIKQVADSLKKYLPNYQIKVITGEDEESKMIGLFIPHNDILCFTPQILVNNIQKGSVKSLTEFSLLILDECHHTKGDEPYNNLMRHYFTEKVTGVSNLPQVLGLTENFGLGKSHTDENTRDYMRRVCACLDVTVLSTVVRHREEYLAYANEPTEEVIVMEKPAVDPCRDILLAAIEDTENKLQDLALLQPALIELMVEKCPPNKESQEYNKWTIEIMKAAQQGVDDLNSSRNISTCAKYLNNYNAALEVNGLLRPQDVVMFLADRNQHESQQKEKLTDFENKLLTKLQEIQKSLAMRGREFANPNAIMVKNALVTMLKDKRNDSPAMVLVNARSRAMVFVKARATCKALAKFLATAPDLQEIGVKTGLLYGKDNRGGEDGMTEGVQNGILEKFRQGHFKVLVATSVGVEGIDVPDCNIIKIQMKAGHESFTNEDIIQVLKSKHFETNMNLGVLNEETYSQIMKDTYDFGNQEIAAEEDDDNRSSNEDWWHRKRDTSCNEIKKCEDDDMKSCIDTEDLSIDTSLPLEILRMDMKSINLYKQALTEGKEVVHNIRVMVVGHFGVGKTALTKRLLGENVDINARESTNGIEVHQRRCKVSLPDGQWTVLQKEEKSDDTFKRLAKLLARQRESLKTGIQLESTVLDANCVNYRYDANGAVMGVESLKAEENLKQTSSHDLDNEDTDVDSGDKQSVDLGPDIEDDKEDDNTHNPQVDKEQTFRKDLEELILQADNSNLQEDKDVANLSIWDFAGQSAFYTTHQVFLSPRAIYLLVTDISKHIDDVVIEDECYFDSSGSTSCKISEFVEFWLNSIHGYCPSSKSDVPPVILIGTHADQLEQFCLTFTLNQRKDEQSKAYFEDMRNFLANKVVQYHLADEDFVVDNTLVDPTLDALKKKILEVASQQDYWGELVPARWIRLEKALVELRDQGLKIIKTADIENMNHRMSVPIDTNEELQLFLRFHHDSGSILFFREEALQDYVLLDPQWLVDAFKCLITAKRFCFSKPDIFPKWQEFNNGAILTWDLIDAVWKKEENESFYVHRHHLIGLLEKLDIIAKPRTFNDDRSDTTVRDYFFAPCVLKDPPPPDILTPSQKPDSMSTTKLCFTVVTRFIPTPVFHRLLASCLTRWPISKQDEKDQIYCGCGIFDVDAMHRLTLYFGENVIQIWVTKYGLKDPQPVSAICIEVREFVKQMLQRIIGLVCPCGELEIFVKCPNVGAGRSGLLKLNDLLEAEEIPCHSHGNSHVLTRSEMLQFWFSEYGSKINHGVEPVLSDETLERSPREREMAIMSKRIGKEYQNLAVQLGLKQVEIEQLLMDNPHSVTDRIRCMLMKWKNAQGTHATFRELEIAMKNEDVDTADVFKDIR